MLSANLEKTLHRALAFANERRHEFATLEHLLLALTEDSDAIAVLRACGVDLDRLRRELNDYVDNELANLITTAVGDAKPTAGFQRVLQRAAIHVQSSGREEVTGANVLVAMFSERESNAVYFLQEQEMSRLDAVNYISHGIAKVPGKEQKRTIQGADDEAKGENVVRKGHEALDAYCVDLNAKAREGRVDPLIGRRRDRAHDPGAVPAHQEQPALRRRARRRQDRDRRGPGPAYRLRRGARGSARRDHLRPRHGRASGRHALSRRLRGAPEGGHRRAGEPREGSPLHRRDPYGDRRRRHLGRRHGRLEPAQAGAAERHPALHRLDHLQGIPQLLREGPGPGPALPEDRHQRAQRRGHGQDPTRPQAVL